MFVLRCGEWAAREFNNYSDAHTAGLFVTLITRDPYTVTEERRLNGVNVEPALVDLFRSARVGSLVACIKAARALTGASLKESKDFIDSL